MARLYVAFDPSGRLEPMSADHCQALAADSSPARQAMLDLPDDLADRDIYEIARKLAELLLEQL